MEIKELISYYMTEVNKMTHEKENNYVDDFEIEWTISLYQDFVAKLKELDEYN
ncbi:hypothetical protein [Vagococcus luciliae]|uniref:Phage protein n=1 Tax=Vagococcus luciliae TaxID=2920380 RepID=A0ABY5NX46_9ENTE|nr:hypothetical protein [Vagococcus luciliae]UUV98169.1 hypothetical protein G314FT_02600 [Vagococcus luciliae]